VAINLLRAAPRGVRTSQAATPLNQQRFANNQSVLRRAGQFERSALARGINSNLQALAPLDKTRHHPEDFG
jgi:hypothetical protein